MPLLVRFYLKDAQHVTSRLGSSAEDSLEVAGKKPPEWAINRHRQKPAAQSHGDDLPLSPQSPIVPLSDTQITALALKSSRTDACER